MKDIEYNGEFGYEMIGVVPYAYYLFKNKQLNSTTSSIDTQCFYFFSINHNEIYDKRVYRDLSGFPFTSLHSKTPNFEQWEPPPYKEFFRNSELLFPKPIYIISNKYNDEWGRGPINFLPTDVLMEICLKLKDQYQIIYNRPETSVKDNSKIFNLNEKESLKSIGVKILEDIPHSSFNELQCKIFANCENFISVQGGGSILSSYFGGQNKIFAIEGGEIDCGSYNNWYNKLSNCEVSVYSDYKSLIESL